MPRYWVRLVPLEPPTAANLGIGVTAFDREDALNLIKRHVFPDRRMPPVVEIIENVDVSTLDRRHVIPNMHPAIRPGIWFPKGYEDASA
jgi:hypothetical protein